MIHEATDADFNTVVPETGTVLVDFHAQWCGPCKGMAPSLQKLAEQLPDLTVVKVDVDQAREVSVGFGVRAVPTLVLLKDGNVVNQKSGAMTLAQLHQFVSG